MGDAYILSLEVDDNGSVVIKNFKKNVEDAGGAAAGAGNKAGTEGSGGFHLFGLAAAKAGDQLGIPFRASNMLGTQIEKLARSAFPAWGMALGVAGGAAMVAAGVTMYLINSKKELVEATKKNVDALRGEVDALYIHTPQTYAAEKATKAYLEARREQLKIELVKMIRDETEKIEDQQEKLKALNKTFLEKESYTQNELIAMGRSQAATRELTANIAALTAKRKADQIYLDSLNKNVSYTNFSGWEEGAAKRKERADAEGLARINREQMTNAAILESARLKATDLASIQAIEMEQFDQVTKAKLYNIDKYEAREDYRLQRSIERAGVELKNTKATEKMKMQYAQQTLDHGANAFKMLADLGGTYGRAAFLAYQGAAIGKTIMSTRTAYMLAMAEIPPPYGQVVAGAIALEGAASVATIAMQKYDGGGGGAGGGGAVGTYSANPGTGLPENGGYKYYDYEQSHYGSGWRPGEGPSGGDTYIFHGDVYDKEAFDKRVNKSVQQNIKDRGDTAKTITRYT